MTEETEGVDPARYGPGTFGCHEALHEASIILELLDGLYDHSAIRLNPEWRALAEKALDATYDLYNAIGKVHLMADGPPEP